MELPTAYPLRDLFDAAVRRRAIRLTCPRCGHTAILSSPALWWLFERKGWRDRFHEVQRRFFCRSCRQRGGIKVRPRLELSGDPPTDNSFPFPSELDWKRELRRRR
ncbi:MAG: hypothetical protein ACXWUN_05890 [Allosphingosinicella sp.]